MLRRHKNDRHKNNRKQQQQQQKNFKNHCGTGSYLNNDIQESTT